MLGAGRAAWAQGSQGPPAQQAQQGPAPLIQRSNGQETVVIPLNQVGIFDASFLNRRNPPQIDNSKILIFDNRTSSRTMVIKFEADGKTVDEVKALLRYQGGPVNQRKAYEGDGTTSCKKDKCLVTVKISKRSKAMVPVKAFARPSGLASFSLSFYEDDEDPAQPKGYFIPRSELRPNETPKPIELEEPADSTAWSMVAAVSAAREPDTGDDKKRFSASSPYAGERDRHYAGTGELRLRQTMGYRADADVTIGFKDGDLGAKDQSMKLGVNKYRVNVYALTGVTLSFGKFTFASPTNSLAIKEKGEGFRFAYRHFAISHIMNRESATGEADNDNRDNRELIIEGNNLSGRNWSGNLIAVYGRERLTAAATADKPAIDAHYYFTGGGELFFAVGRRLGGSWALYGSQARAIKDSAFPRSSGISTFATLTRNILDADGKVFATLTAQGGASSRRRSTDDASVNRAYVGEHTGFEPDTLFLAGLAGKVDGSLGLGSGLANKTYFGVQYNDQRFSLLQYFKEKPRTKSKDIDSRSTTLGWHHYTSGRATDSNGRLSADEFNLTFQMEAPAKVEWSLQGGYLWTHQGLKTVLGRPWSIVGKVKVSL